MFSPMEMMENMCVMLACLVYVNDAGEPLWLKKMLEGQCNLFTLCDHITSG
jgi:hypothetical protein